MSRAAESDSTTAAPASLGELFFTFTRLALQGFGGVLPVAQRELVERKRWFTTTQFVEMLSVAQVLPGPNIVNLALMFGDRCFGLRGAFTALAGMLLAPLVVVLLLTATYAHLSQLPPVAGALRGIGAVAAGLILSTAVKLLGVLRVNPIGRAAGFGLAALTFVAVGMLRWPLVWVVLSLGPIGIGWAWWQLRRR